MGLGLCNRLTQPLDCIDFSAHTVNTERKRQRVVYILYRTLSERYGINSVQTSYGTVQIGLYVAACDIQISTFDSSECLQKHTHTMK